MIEHNRYVMCITSMVTSDRDRVADGGGERRLNANRIPV
jgi:hypothetical protein